MNKLSNVTSQDTERLSRVFAALGDATRFKIVEELIACEQDCNDICVGELAAKLNVSSSAISQHFRLLEMNAIVRPERMGQKICYQLQVKDPLVSDLIKLIKKNKGE